MKIIKWLKKIYNKLFPHLDYETIQLKRHWKELETRGYTVAALMLQGSQNYGLQEYSQDYWSDVDSKAIVLPTFKDFCLNKKPISTTIILDNNEHIEVKDIRIMFDMFKKENISYIELLFTKWKIINPRYKKYMNQMFAHANVIAAYSPNQFVKCIAGMAMEKRKALCHPYLTLIEKIEKYGFDGKQLSHCARLYEFLSKFYCGVPLGECYRASDIQSLVNMKKQLTPAGDRIMTKEEAVEMCDKLNDAIGVLKNNYLERGNEISEQALPLLDNICYKVLKKKFRRDLWIKN